MKVFRINYTADNKRYTLLMSAADEKAAIKNCKKLFRDMEFTEAWIDSIKAID